MKRLQRTWQRILPVFVRYPFSADGKDWSRGERFNWSERNISEKAVENLFKSGFIYHNAQLEVEQKTGDRLNELGRKQLDSLVRLVNKDIEKMTNSQVEFKKKKIKFSRLDDKQRTHIRMWLHRFPEFEDSFLKHRDYALDKKSQPVEATEDEVEDA